MGEKEPNIYNRSSIEKEAEEEVEKEFSPVTDTELKDFFKSPLLKIEAGPWVRPTEEYFSVEAGRWIGPHKDELDTGQYFKTWKEWHRLPVEERERLWDIGRRREKEIRELNPPRPHEAYRGTKEEMRDYQERMKTWVEKFLGLSEKEQRARIRRNLVLHDVGWLNVDEGMLERTAESYRLTDVRVYEENR